MKAVPVRPMPLRFQRVRTVSATEAVVARIVEMIESGALAPGARLPAEETLSTDFGVGRSSVREAKRLLMARRVLETRSSRGTFVCERDVSDLLPDDMLRKLLTSETLSALQEARELIEVYSMELAVDRADQQDVARLRDCLEVMEREAGRRRVAYDAGLRFHIALVEATHNSVLGRVYELIADFLKVHQAPTYSREVDAQTEYREHRRLYEALVRRDKRKLTALMRQHLAYVKHHSS